VIKLSQVTQLVDDDVVGMAGWEESQAITEIQIAFLGAAAPAGLLIADRDLLIFKSVKLIEILQPLMD
jgi:hypothetical protein